MAVELVAVVCNIVAKTEVDIAGNCTGIVAAVEESVVGCTVERIDYWVQEWVH